MPKLIHKNYYLQSLQYFVYVVALNLGIAVALLLHHMY